MSVMDEIEEQYIKRIVELEGQLVEAKERCATNDERLDWIACASFGEIREMLAHSVCDDVEDLKRFIDSKRGGGAASTGGK